MQLTIKITALKICINSWESEIETFRGVYFDFRHSETYIGNCFKTLLYAVKYQNYQIKNVYKALIKRK